MKIAIAADLHENYHHFSWFAADVRARGITRCLFLGDIVNPGLCALLADSGLALHVVLGNNDGDHVRIAKILLERGHAVADYCFAEVEIEGRAVFLTHYPLLGRLAAESGRYAAAFYGHNHKKHEERVQGTLLVNPGELSGHLTGTVSYYVWDTETNDGAFVINDNPRIARDLPEN